MLSASRGAVRLLHEGSLALSEVEANGIRIDTDYLAKATERTKQQLKDVENDIRKDHIAIEWRKRYGSATNYGSPDQLSFMLFKVLKLKPLEFTKTGKPKTDVAALEKIDLPLIKLIGKRAKLEKLHGTYLKGLRREVVDGYLHPVFSLHTVQTYRSSSSDPNFQNLPIRDPVGAKLIRRAFVPRKDHVLVEIDYSAIEVRIAACYHQDPTMIKYIETDHDMHLDMAVECFRLTPDQVRKEVRHVAKNSFVFPEFYGDYYIKIARGMWEAITRRELQRTDGVLLVDHLKKQGIKELGDCNPKNPPRLGTFEKHIRDIEHRFWNRRFPVYRDWKESIWNKYQEQGMIKTKTGFVIQGVLKRNEVINWPVQGSAFHCLLWSLIQVNKRLHGMRSLVVGQIHDSMLLDVHKNEFNDVLPMVKEIMTTSLKKAFKWIIVPIDIEAEASDVNWYEKKVIAV